MEPLSLELPGDLVVPARSWSHRVTMDLTRDRRDPSLRVTGRSQHHELVVTRRVDRATPLLYRWCSAGEVLPRVSLLATAPPEAIVPTEGEEPVEGPRTPWFRFVLEDVIVTSVLTSMEEDAPPLETISLSYREVRWVHEPDGVEAAWDPAER